MMTRLQIHVVSTVEVVHFASPFFSKHPSVLVCFAHRVTHNPYMCPAPTPLEYLEYDEEVEEQQEDDEDNLFGSDPEQESGDPIAVPGSTAGPSTGSLERYNPARPLPSGAQGLITSSTRGGPPSSSSYKGKEKARPVDPRDRLEQLRFMRTPKNVRGPDSRGADSLKAITMISTSRWTALSLVL